MPVNVPTQIHFIQRLYREGRIGLDAVYDIFYKTPKSRNLRTLESILLSHYADGKTGELIVIDRETGEDAPLPDDTVLENPERYDVVYNGCAGTEASEFDMFAGRLICEDGDEDGMDAEVVSPELVTIHGDSKAALPQIRRLEGFTNYVGHLVIQRRFEDFSALFWDRENEKHTPQGLETKFAELERKYGHFEVFHEPKVYTIYAGEGRGHKHFEEMKPPKGATRDQRVGASGFCLASSITPNGIPRWGMDVYLETVEAKAGEFRITHIEWRFTY